MSEKGAGSSATGQEVAELGIRQGQTPGQVVRPLVCRRKSEEVRCACTV
jgi:hypothetical protein